MAPDSVRVGVIGAGHWAQTAHLPAIRSREDTTLAAISEPHPPNLARAEAEFAPEAAYADYRQMLDEVQLDAAVIAVPHKYHFAVAKDCLSRGLHVLIEKPMTIESQHADRLVEMADGAGLQIVVGYTWHYNNQCDLARQWIQSGRLGRLQLVASFFGSTVLDLYQGDPSRHRREYGSGEQYFGPRESTYSDPVLAGGGQGQTQLTHILALALFLTGMTPTRLNCLMADLNTTVDVVDALIVEFQEGALGTFATTGAVAPPSHTDTLEYRIYGADGHLHLDVSEGGLTIYDEENPSGLRAPNLAEPLRYPTSSPLDNLIELVKGGGENRSPGSLGREVVHVLSAAYESAGRGGVPVSIP